MKLFIQIFLFVMSLPCLDIHGQAISSFTPQIINFYKSEYGASNQNWSIDQTPDGAMVVGNNKGLLISNGGEWNLHEVPGQKIVRCVAASKDGRIYTGAYSEFGYWDKSKYGDWQYHSLNKLVKTSLFQKEEVWKILIASNGDVYFQSFSSLYKYSNGKIDNIPTPGNIMYLFEIRHRLYIPVLGKGIYELKNGQFFPRILDKMLQTDEVISLLPTRFGDLLIGTVHNGMFISKGNQLLPFANDLNVYLSKNQLNTSISLTDSTYALGTIENGLLRIDEHGNILETYNQRQGLQNNTVLGLKKDKINNLWAALDKGFAEIALQSPFRFFKDVNGSFGSVYTGAIFQNELYIGTNQGLFYKDLKDRNAYFHKIDGLNGQIWNLSVIDNQLFCGHNKGTSIIENHAIKSVSNISGGWFVKKLHNNDSVLLQGTYIGLAVYIRDQNGNWQFRNIVKGTENIPIYNWFEDAQGHIWLSHMYKGIYLVALNSDLRSTKSFIDLTNAQGLDPRYRESLFSYENNVLVSSSGGILFPSWNHGKIQFKKEASINKKFSLIYDAKKIFFENNQYWGVFEDNIIRLVSADFSKSSTFNFKDFSLVGGYENIVALNNLYNLLCGENGFALYENIHSDISIPEQMTLTNAFYHKKDTLIPFESGNKKESIELSYNQNELTFIVNTPIYDHQVLYKFRLDHDGKTGSWSNWNTSGTKIFDNLGSGDYHFLARNNVNNQTVSLNFKIDAPWYWNIWSKIVYILIFCFLLHLVNKKMQKRFSRQLLAKQKEMDEQLHMQQLEHEHELLIAQQDQLQKEVEVRSEDLANSASELIKRKKLLNKMHNELEKIKDTNTSNTNIKKLSKELDRQLQLDKHESKLFEKGFNTIHDQFFQKLLLQFPDLTPADLRLAAYLRMNLGSKEIAPLLSITVRGVELKRYRLRKKMQLSADENLNEFMMTF